MQASIIIPLWNGATVITLCLDALYPHFAEEPFEIICVDNASQDESATLIVERYPRVRLLRQPVNSGFAGGINAGIDAAQGDLFVLLNQDCAVQPGWWSAITQAFETRPEFGVAGCTVLTVDGTVNHAGAMISRPSAYGIHYTEIGDSQPRSVDYVTGAAFAIRRQTWEAVGRFDEGYYPGYFEESDYCYRARSKGIETAYVPQARVTHLFSSREWQVEPVRHTANQHRSRFRFVSKHFNGDELSQFFEAEYEALNSERWFDQAVGRMIGARDTLRALPDIIERRRFDLGTSLPGAQRRQLEVGFTQVLRRAFARAEQLSPIRPLEQVGRSSQEAVIAPQPAEPPIQAALCENLFAIDEPRPALAPPPSLPSLSAPPGLFAAENWQAEPPPIHGLPHVAPSDEHARYNREQAISQQLHALKQREYDLLTRIYFKAPSADRAEPLLRRAFRLLLLRPLSFLIGRDYLLLSELNTVHVARMDATEELNKLYRERQERNEQLRWRLQEQVDRLSDWYREQLDRLHRHQSAQLEQMSQIFHAQLSEHVEQLNVQVEFVSRRLDDLDEQLIRASRVYRDQMNRLNVQMIQVDQGYRSQFAHLIQQLQQVNRGYQERIEQTTQLLLDQRNQLDRRLALLELLTEYDYR